MGSGIRSAFSLYSACLGIKCFSFCDKTFWNCGWSFWCFSYWESGTHSWQNCLEERSQARNISQSTLQYSSRNFDSSEVPLTTGVNSPHTHSPHGSLQGYQGGGGVSEERRSPTSPNKQKHRRTLLSSAAPIDVLIKVLNICKSLQLPKTFNEQKRHGITQGLRLKLKRMMNLTARNINELTHLFCAHVRLQTAHKMHLDSQHFEHLQFEACVVFGTMNVLFGNIHFQLSICTGIPYVCHWTQSQKKLLFIPTHITLLTIIVHGFWVLITEFPKCFSKEELF